MKENSSFLKICDLFPSKRMPKTNQITEIASDERTYFWVTIYYNYHGFTCTDRTAHTLDTSISPCHHRFQYWNKKKLRMRKKKKLLTFLRSESVGLSLSQLYLLDLGIDNGDLIFVFPSFFLLYVCLMSFVCLDLLRKVCPCSAKVAR